MSGTEPRPARRGAERRLTGIAVSPGVAIGPVFLAAEAPTAVLRAGIDASQVPAELARFEQAVEQSQKQVRKLRSRLAILPQDGQIELSPLLDAYAMMMGPSRLTRGIRARIAERLVDAPTAVVEEVEWQAAAVLALPGDDPDGLARRAAEIGEIGLRLVRNLLQTPFRSLAALPAGAVLVCDNLRPADAALLDPTRLCGVAVEDGGAEGHTAIMLRALAIPAALGVVGLMAAARSGETIVVDGQAGTVTLRPGDAALQAARASATGFALERQRMQRLRRLPAITVCGTIVELQANLEIPAELPLVAQSGAAGIGLLRSEFLFINRDTLPDEAVQFDTYRQIIEAMAPDPVTVRVLDWGGEKESEAMRAAGLMPQPPELNPALGLRGIRLLLKHPSLLEVQLAAVLRASVHGQARVLLPMVCRVSEVRAARAVMLRVAQRLRRRGDRLPDKLPPLGIMIETPAAALSADALAEEADFFAIGTNDLTMYALAADRGESALAALFDPLHPGVLRLVRFAIDAAQRVRKPVSVCGEVAGDPRLTKLLLGMGLRSFSMTAAALPRVKQSVRGATMDECVRFAHLVMEQPSAQRVRALVFGA